MPVKPGKPVLAGDVTETRPAADGVEAGDPVSINANGEMDTLDEELAGVARHDGDNDGRGNAMHLSGAIVAAVADGVEDGDRLAPGAEGAAGTLVTSSGGPVLALSDEGGTWHGEGINAYDVPDGYAVVHL